MSGDPSLSPAEEPEVTVVGAGPVGMTLAALLGARGRRVMVLDRRPRPSGAPRAVHLDHQACRILDAAGVMAELAPHTEVMDAYEWRNGAGRVLLRLQPDGPVGRSGWPESVMFAQPDLEDALARRLGRLASVDVRRGVEVASLDGLDGWVVGCDGAGSTVRGLLGVDVEDSGWSFDWLVVDVVEGSPRHWLPCNLQVCDPQRPTTAVSGGPGRRRFEFMRLPGEDAGVLASEAAAWRLLEPWALTPGNCTLERHALYRFDARMASPWGKGRVWLAGDAAHQMPPFAGQGLCAGLRDAANLAWKLDLVLAGAAPAGLVATYGQERTAQTRVEIDVSVELGRIICVADADAAAARDAAMGDAFDLSGPIAPPLLPPLGPGLLLAGDPAAGTLGVQGQVTRRGHSGHLDTVIGRGFVLHGRHHDPAAGLRGAEAEWFASIGGLGADCSGAGAPYDGWFEELGADVVLVRPDFAVYGTASGPWASAELVGALRAQLAALPAIP